MAGDTHAQHGQADPIDHFFFDKGTIKFVHNRLNRILPEIVKAFQYRATRYETLRMVCKKAIAADLRTDAATTIRRPSIDDLRCRSN